jgi:phosphomevalonate kinase
MKSISNENLSLGLFALSISSIVIYKNIIIHHNKRKDNNKKVSCISAPGKVLIAGGYVVLEHPNLAITLSASSRFYTIIKLKQFTSDLLSLIKSSSSSSSSSSLNVTIVVDSPQFHTRYIYTYKPIDDKLINVLTISTDINNNNYNNTNEHDNSHHHHHYQAKSNPFIEKSILLTLSFIKKHYCEDGKDFITFLQQSVINSDDTQYLYIKLQANNDFYSQTKLVR